MRLTSKLVVVSATTRAALTTSEFELEAMPAVNDKGNDAPLEAYRAAWERGEGPGAESTGS